MELAIFYTCTFVTDFFVNKAAEPKEKSKLQCSFHPYKICLLRSDGTRIQELIPVIIVANFAMLVSFV